MKKVLYLIITMMLLMPIHVFAVARAQSLPETLEAISTEISIDDYEESDDQVVLYLFWSSTCPHCHEEINWFNEILPEYKDKIKLRTYEVTNSDNIALKDKFTNFFEVDAPGVPFLAVADSTFYGFKDSFKDEILQVVDQEYSLSKEERYNTYDEVQKGKPANYTPLIIFGVFGGIILILIIVMMLTKKSE